tara:strand:+ start:765 stop:1721 length:957 start_codon:yes stop_codon:yes gene_type:complete
MNNLKILCITPIKHIPNVENSLEELGQLTILEDPSPKDLELIPKDFNVIFTNPNKSKIFIGPDVFSKWSDLNCVCTASTGTVHIDKNYLHERNIKLISLTEEYDVLNTISSTAELAFTLMMASLRKLIPAHNSVKSGLWDYEPFVGRQINKLKICIFGFGRLGSMFAHYCKSFGADVFIYDPYKDIPSNYKEISHLNSDLKEMDVISIHMHVNDETKNFFDKSKLAYFKSNVLIINTSRGELINEDDLVCFLENNKDAHISTDVLSGEIFGFQKSKLFKYSQSSNQVLISPHIGGMTIDAQEIAYCHAIKLLKEHINK